MSEKKIVVITGGTRGIGKGIALRFADKDHFVVVTGRSDGTKVVDAIRDNGGDGAYIKLDASNEVSVQDCFAKIKEDFGGTDILINNAGIAKDFLLMRSKSEDWKQVVDINLMGAMYCAQAATKQMVKKKWGRIINLSSITALKGSPGQTVYSATKAALNGFTRSLAKELGSRNITVNSIAPGFIDTDMTADLPEDLRSQYLKEISVGRFGSPADIAGAAFYLASNEAAFVTGQVLVVDGGMI
jgi:3-oxoacyl-[acyl-carrier protein] reductase